MRPLLTPSRNGPRLTWRRAAMWTGTAPLQRRQSIGTVAAFGWVARCRLGGLGDRKAIKLSRSLCVAPRSHRLLRYPGIFRHHPGQRRPPSFAHLAASQGADRSLRSPAVVGASTDEPQQNGSFDRAPYYLYSISWRRALLASRVPFRGANRTFGRRWAAGGRRKGWRRSLSCASQMSAGTQTTWQRACAVGCQHRCAGRCQRFDAREGGHLE